MKNMYELIQVGTNTYVIDCPAKIGLFVEGERAFLIDSGNDKDAGKKVLKILESRGWQLAAILNTHSHADHIGGNRLLQERTGCPVYAPDAEVAAIRHPWLEPTTLYGGFPCRALRNKFLMAQPSDVRGLETLTLPQGMEVIPLPGHTPQMVGFRTPDSVVFLADCLSGETILEKYHVSYLYDLEEYLKTLDRVAAMEAALFVPAHAPAATDIRPLAEVNRRKAEEIAGLLRAFCRPGRTAEELLQAVFDHYDLPMDFNQYVLVGSTIRSYLSALCDRGEIRPDFAGRRLLWCAAD